MFWRDPPQANDQRSTLLTDLHRRSPIVRRKLAAIIFLLTLIRPAFGDEVEISSLYGHSIDFEYTEVIINSGGDAGWEHSTTAHFIHRFYISYKGRIFDDWELTGGSVQFQHYNVNPRGATYIAGVGLSYPDIPTPPKYYGKTTALRMTRFLVFRQGASFGCSVSVSLLHRSGAQEMDYYLRDGSFRIAQSATISDQSCKVTEGNILSK